MADTLEIFGVEYTNVEGIIATDDNGNELTYTRGARVTQDQDGYIVLPKTGGDGGSSDFSTATVTIVNGNEMWIEGAFIGNDEDFQVQNTMLAGKTALGSPCVLPPLVLYKGKAEIGVVRAAQSVTENAEIIDGEGYYLLITGDCTITFS